MPSRKAPATASAAEKGVRDATSAVLLVKTAQASVMTGPAVDHLHADGVLHPAVGHDDEVGGERPSR